MKRKLVALVSAIIMSMMMFSTALAMPDDSQWYWLSSDAKYSKYYGINTIKVEQSFGNVAVRISAMTRTDYTPEGAEETLKNYGITNVGNAQLKYSLAQVEINPQNRTFSYISEKFCDENDNVLWEKKYEPLRPKEMNSQEFDEEFYVNIVDAVFGAGEEVRRKADDRWLTLWNLDNVDGSKSRAMADTTTIRMKGENVIYWEWMEIKSPEGKVKEIRFQKKSVNLSNQTGKVNRYQQWDGIHGWRDLTKDTDGMYHAIENGSSDFAAYNALMDYVKSNSVWAYRYSLD